MWTNFSWFSKLFFGQRQETQLFSLFAWWWWWFGDGFMWKLWLVRGSFQHTEETMLKGCTCVWTVRFMCTILTIILLFYLWQFVGGTAHQSSVYFLQIGSVTSSFQFGRWNISIIAQWLRSLTGERGLVQFVVEPLLWKWSVCCDWISYNKEILLKFQIMTILVYIFALSISTSKGTFIERR